MRKHERVRPKRLEDRGHADVGPEAHERAKQHVALALRAEDRRRQRQHRKRDHAQAIEQIEDAVLGAERSHGRRGSDRVEREEREQEMNPRDPDRRCAACARGAHQQQQQDANDHDAIRQKREAGEAHRAPAAREDREDDRRTHHRRRWKLPQPVQRVENDHDAGRGDDEPLALQQVRSALVDEEQRRERSGDPQVSA